MSSRVLFLDIDGVLVTSRSQLAAGRPHAFDADACALVSECCRRAGAAIVVSSTWREGETRASFLTAIAQSGLHESLLHKDWATPVLRDRRQLEIDAWLAQHPEVDTWAILDDGIGLDETSPRLVQTEIDDGLLFEHVLRLCGILDVDASAWLADTGVQYTKSDRHVVDRVRDALARHDARRNDD